jgi:hypothetical protein
MPTDFRSLFAMFHARHLRCVAVGGLALVLHGIDRPTIDIFTDCPIPFEELWREAVNVEVADGIPVKVASVDHLIRLKQIAGRPQDLADIQRLEGLRMAGRST